LIAWVALCGPISHLDRGMTLRRVIGSERGAQGS
jgi:hypothetical protein